MWPRPVPQPTPSCIAVLRRAASHCITLHSRCIGPPTLSRGANSPSAETTWELSSTNPSHSPLACAASCTTTVERIEGHERQPQALTSSSKPARSCLELWLLLACPFLHPLRSAEKVVYQPRSSFFFCFSVFFFFFFLSLSLFFFSNHSTLQGETSVSLSGLQQNPSSWAVLLNLQPARQFNPQTSDRVAQAHHCRHHHNRYRIDV